MLGPLEWVVIIVVIIAFVRPENLKDYIKGFYKAMDTVKTATKEAKEELNELTDPVKEIKEDITSTIKEGN